MIDEQYLTRVIGKVAEQTVIKKMYPSGIVVGTITSMSPATVKISDEITIPAEALIIGDQFAKFEFTTESAGSSGYRHTHNIKWDNSLKVGDVVYMLRDTGGQTYYIFRRRERKETVTNNGS